ncbi:MAG: hypothetical protein ACRC31_00880, partial [Cetobacterium sp.]
CSSTCPKICCAAVKWFLSEMLDYEVSGVIVDARNLSVHKKVSAWKLAFWVEVMKHLLESTFFNSINRHLIYTYEFSNCSVQSSCFR